MVNENDELREAVLAEVERRKADSDYMERIERHVRENQAALDRLAYESIGTKQGRSHSRGEDPTEQLPKGNEDALAMFRVPTTAPNTRGSKGV